VVPSCALSADFRQEMKQILITGSFGFLGSRLVLHFLKTGWKVRLLDLPNHPLKEQLLTEFGQAGTYELVESDICDYDSVLSAVRGCQEVIHGAALLNSVAPYNHFHRINVQGTKTVCDACVAEGVPHLTLISTSDVFGIPQPHQLLHEESPYRSWNEPYADTKIEAANYVKALRAKGQLKASIVYPGWIYGEGDRQFFPAVMDMVRDGIVFTWHKSKASDIYFVHVEDPVLGIDRILHTSESSNRDYLLLDPASGITPLALYGIIADYLNIQIKHFHVPYPIMMLVALVTQWLTRIGILSKPVLSSTDVKAFGNAFQFCTERAANELNWMPCIPTREGIVRALNWQTRQAQQGKV